MMTGQIRGSRRTGRLCGVAAAALALVLVPAAAWASVFPVNEPFHTDTTNNPHWSLLGSARLTNQGTGWLQLTPADPSRQAGAATLNEEFSSHLGLDIDFQYAAWGGTPSPFRGDGFTFFLINGSAAPSAGENGNGLGYRGMTGAYAGVGFDSYGGFSGRDRIGVRGSARTGTPTPLLTSALAPGGIETGNNTTGVRDSRITLRPDADGHLLLSVFSNRGPGTPLETVINNFNLGTAPGQGPLPPTLKLGFSAGTGDATNNHEIRDLHVTAPADLSIVKQAPLEVQPGGHVHYVLHVADNGPSPVAGAVVRDTVPSSITGVTWKCAPVADATCDAPDSGSGNDVASHVTFTRQGGTAQIIINGTLSRLATIGDRVKNTATITPPADREELTPDDNTSPRSFTVGNTPVPGTANLSITKTVNDPHPLYNHPVTFALTLTNHGPDDVREAIVRDQLPAGLVYLSDDSASTGTHYEPASGTWDAGSLPSGHSRTLRVTASVQTRVPVTNLVDRIDTDVEDPTPCPSHCGDAVRVTPRYADLKVSKTARPDRVRPGGTVTYHVTVKNAGNAPAPGVTVADKLPAHVTYVSDDSAGAYDPRTGIWHAGDLGPGQSRTLRITVRVHATTTNVITRADSGLPDPDPCGPGTLGGITQPYGCPPGATVTVVRPPTVPVTG